jgi:hypothetical protein
VQPVAQLGGRDLAPFPALPATVDLHAGHADHPDHPCKAEELHPAHEALCYGVMPEPEPTPTALSLRDAVADAATGDVWLFRGSTMADRTIRLFTNSPVNHVGVVLAIDDLPPLLWHAEMGASMPNVWTGERHRGTQLHHLDRAVSVWTHRYGQQPWFRPIDITATPEMENRALAVVAEYSGRGFPGTGALARHWLSGRLRRRVSLTDIYCAELVAVTFERMGLLGPERPANWYDPGRFWSGDRLQLIGAELGPEVAVVDVGPIEEWWREG